MDGNANTDEGVICSPSFKPQKSPVWILFLMETREHGRGQVAGQLTAGSNSLGLEARPPASVALKRNCVVTEITANV